MGLSGKMENVTPRYFPVLTCWGLNLPVEEAVISEESSGGLDPGRHVVDVDQEE